jgi:membrane fusion protein (multidrug efflux system)
LLIEIDPRDFEAAFKRAQANLDAAIAGQGAAEADLELTKASTAAGIQLAQASLEAARHGVAQDQSQVAAAAADAELARSTLQRVQDLFQRKFDSQQQLDDAKATAQGTEARYQSAIKAVAMAQSQVAEAQARLVQAQTAPQQLAVKQAAVLSAKAQVELAQAELTTARLNLSYTKIRAPQAGRITKRAVDVGDVVQAGQTLTSMVVGEPWITANFKETQLTRMQPGQPVSITIDAYPGQELKGRVDSIQAGTGSRFSLLPPENATGNFVKVVQRVPVKIVLDDPEAIRSYLALGMSVEPTVDVAAAPEPVSQPADAGSAATP